MTREEFINQFKIGDTICCNDAIWGKGGKYV